MSLFDSHAIIADRAEFAEILNRLHRGHVLVRTGEGACTCMIDGAFVYHSFAVLRDWGLIEAFHNRLGFPGVEYWRITPQGRGFAERIWHEWRARAPLERLMMRFTG